MKIKLQTKLSILIFSCVASPLSADFTEATSDYSKATVERWTEDRTNDYVHMADSFACIIQKSKTDLLHNHSYMARISEVDCGLEDEEINDFGVSNITTLSDVIFKTSRASNTSPQEGTFWFNTYQGSKAIGNIVIKRNEEQLPPYGEWTSAYYFAAGPDGVVAFNSSSAQVKGYVKISELENGNVIIESHDTVVRGSEDSTWSSKIQYFDTDFNSSQVLGYGRGTDDNGDAISELLAAKTNATHMYSASFLNPTTRTSGSCYKRDQVWKSGYDYGVFKESDGSRLTVSGGFGFNYDESGTTYRGHISSWGADFYQNKTTAFSSSSTTKSVTSTKDSTAYTLSWAPGILDERTLVPNELFTSETPVNGKIYGVYSSDVDFESTRATVKIRYNSSASAYEAKYYKDDGTQITDPYTSINNDDVISTTDISSKPQIGWLWDEAKWEWVYWNGGDGIEYHTSKNVSSDTDLLTASNGWTAFQAYENRAPGLNLPVNGALFNGDSGDAWLYTEKANSENDDYYFTSSTPPEGFLARTLYTDPTGNGPVIGATDDKPVMFDFSAYWNQNSEGDWKIKYVPFGSEASLDLVSNKWPFKYFDLKLTADNSKRYRWSFGAFVSDNSVLALKADGSIYTIEQPKILKYVHAETKDMNRGQTINYFADQTNNNNPVKSLCGVVSGNYECEVEPTDFGGTTYNLKYDGNWLDGLPDMQAKLTVDARYSHWMRLINPEAGTVVTETVDGTTTNYVLKPLGVGETYVPDNSTDALTSTSKCGNLIMTNLTEADFGWTIADLPAVDLVTLSDKEWADQPTELLCTVDNGDASSCVIN